MISIMYSNGRALQGVVLAFGDQVVRVALKDSDDAAEYRLINGVWVSEDCEVVRFEFLDGRVADTSCDEGVLESLFPAPSLAPRLQRVM